MSRAVRTARGAFGALATTLLAAASHGLAGGTATPLSIVATFLVALPLCVLLAGRVGSLWRLALAVAPAQLLYHWSFAGLGAASGPAALSGRAPMHAASGVAESAHHGHLVPASFAPALVEAGAGDASMWLSHALAAALTIVLMHRGERAVVHLVRVLRETMPARVPHAVRLPQHGAILVTERPSRPCPQRIFLSAISHRGPPATALLAH